MKIYTNAIVTEMLLNSFETRDLDFFCFHLNIEDKYLIFSLVQFKFFTLDIQVQIPLNFHDLSLISFFFFLPIFSSTNPKISLFQIY